MPPSGVCVDVLLASNLRRKATLSSGSEASCFHTKSLNESSMFCELLADEEEGAVTSVESAVLA